MIPKYCVLRIPIDVKVQELSDPECSIPSPEHIEFTASPLLSSYLHFKDKQTNKPKQNKLRGLSPQANYTDRATAVCR
jgi:hypothetical protein